MSELAASLCMGVADLVTDVITYARLSSDVAIPNSYKAAYTAILCFAAATTAVSLVYRLNNARLVMVQAQTHLIVQGQHGRVVSANEAQRQVQQHEWELVQTGRTKVILSLSLLSVAAQGAMALRAAMLLLHLTPEHAWQ